MRILELEEKFGGGGNMFYADSVCVVSQVRLSNIDIDELFQHSMYLEITAFSQ
jgi:hypothetical protein